MRADRKAAVEASGGVDEEEEEEELDDSFYPSKLPSRWESCTKRGESCSLTVHVGGTAGCPACLRYMAGVTGDPCTCGQCHLCL